MSESGKEKLALRSSSCGRKKTLYITIIAFCGIYKRALNLDVADGLTTEVTLHSSCVILLYTKLMLHSIAENTSNLDVSWDFVSGNIKGLQCFLRDQVGSIQ